MTTTLTQTITPVVSTQTPTTAIVINVARLVEILMAVRGAEPITFIARTVPAMRKTGNRFVGLVEKVAKTNGMVNVDYTKAVERQLVREGKDVSEFQEGTSWHHAVIRADGTFTPLCQHNKNNSYYLRFVAGNTLESEYRWIANDSPLSTADVAELKTFLQISTYANQSLEKTIKFQTRDLSSIKVLTLEKQTYIIA